MRAWDQYIPHYDLTPDLLPPADTEWMELARFAHTFDGYTIEPTPDLLRGFGEAVEQAFLGDGSLPEGLTRLRTALFYQQRNDHHTGGYGLSPDQTRLARALVEKIRSDVLAGRGRTPDRSTTSGVEDSVINAYERFLVGYAEWGGHRYHGWTDFPDPLNYLGPRIWSERDCGYRFGLELEREWPGGVHMEFAIGKSSRSDFDPSVEKAQRVDLAVSDLSQFVEDDDTQSRFRTQQHEAFFEVKWLLKGWRAQRFEMDARKRVVAVPADLAKLARHVELGRCAVAGMFIVDDEDYFLEHGEADAWPARVWRLLAGPHALRMRGLLDGD